ncbi:MAG: dihydrofolate reductase [Candidatus Poseidoniaceae archaeon]|jgi:dihydrofolate reductase|nr:dihydrofolate reductase [Candidatus Poseidoniaceae archaeon]
MLGMIVACDRNGAIGRNGKLPWKQSTDLKHFKNITLNSNIIMGRKTWESLPGKLPKRRHFVLSRNNVENVETISFDDALKLEGWIIGGGEIYKLFLPHVKTLHRTIIDTRITGADTFFPDITGMGFELIEQKQISAGENDQFDMIFQQWER